ncbi:MAG TPA: hypothetical protein VGP62_03150 [Bryobacteraceae bacterium]|jgi:hypothetical protein|nr:hypothetical protein [Bryobacteraceae bacterium]
MRNLIPAGILFGVLGLAASPASASVMLTLSSPTDLTALTVGENLVVDVNLSGLPVGSDFIFDLDSKVLFSSTLFTTVPDSSSTSGLTTSLASGSVFNFASQQSAFNATSSFEQRKCNW